MMAAATTELPAFQFTDNDALYIPSDRRGQPEWSPAAVQIAYGLAEHIGCDADWIQGFIEAGIVVYDNDNRGPSWSMPPFRKSFINQGLSAHSVLRPSFSGPG